MRIRRLDVTGFKSFMDRTVLTFDRGITGIVGPNGCGKSNLVDAIRWVMGEQSAKHLRGSAMSDVIFGGSEKHAATNLAEVAVTFDVDGGPLPPPYQGLAEITVARRLFRTGESEYQVNGVVARLLDITDVFLGSGVGTKAYSIIEQGRVGQIVSARPEDRRAFIDEAAGVTKYKARPQGRRAPPREYRAEPPACVRRPRRAQDASGVAPPAGEEGGAISARQGGDARSRAARREPSVPGAGCRAEARGGGGKGGPRP